MSQTRDQQRFTMSEVAADWHEPMVPQRIMWPFIARANYVCTLLILMTLGDFKGHANISS